MVDHQQYMPIISELSQSCLRLEVKLESLQMCYFNITLLGVVFVACPRPAEAGAARSPVADLASPRRNMTLQTATTAEKSRSGNSLHATTFRYGITVV